MKRAILLSLILALLVTFGGCAGSTQDTNRGETEKDQAANEDPTTTEYVDSTLGNETAELKEHDLAIEMAKKYRSKYKDHILTVYDLYEYLISQGFSKDVCEYVCFGKGVDGFYNGAAMYDYERVAMFHEQGYSREAIITFYVDFYDELTYSEVEYLVDACLAGRKLTYEYVNGQMELINYGGSGSSSGISQEFKAAMDAYEAFYDEYCALLKEYYNNPMDYSLLTRYMELVERAEEVDEAFEQWNDENLSGEELRYYLEVEDRVIKKLAAVTE